MPRTRDANTDTEPLAKPAGPFQLRMKIGLKQQLEAAARRKGASLNSEIVERLQRSLHAEVHDQEADEATGLLQAVGTVMRTTGGAAKRSADNTTDPKGWIEHPYAYEQAVKAAVHLFEMLKPAGTVIGPKSGGPLADLLLAELGVHFARAMLGYTRFPGPTVLESLGPLADRLPDRLPPDDLRERLSKEESE